MVLTAEAKTKVVSEYRRSEKDSGSPQVQVALLTQRINGLTEHVKTHRQDYASRRGLMMMVSKRNRLLKYLAGHDVQGYQNLINRLGLRK